MTFQIGTGFPGQSRLGKREEFSRSPRITPCRLQHVNGSVERLLTGEVFQKGAGSLHWRFINLKAPRKRGRLKAIVQSYRLPIASETETKNLHRWIKFYNVDALMLEKEGPDFLRTKGRPLAAQHLEEGAVAGKQGFNCSLCPSGGR